jgi:uncharacterized protein (DUF433 family)
MADKKLNRAPVADANAAKDNIRRFERELMAHPTMAEILAYARSWHACRDEGGAWILGPSKFVGYENNSGDAYRKSHNEDDGRVTERILSHWFKPVEPGTALHGELTGVLRRLFARYGKTPNKLTRINVLEADLGSLAAQSKSRDRQSAVEDRITIDPKVCGGRPCIRGMRMRVSDILDMLAGGADRAEILTDFPYIEDTDIDAALEYAARSVDHRVIRAA